jgi:uncharacterized protein (DUF983 family)
MGEMIGRCPKCEEHYYGWALKNPDNHYCEICGCELEIYNYKDAAKFNPFLLYPRYKLMFSKIEEKAMLN